MAKEKNNKKENKRSFMKDFKAELKKVVWPTSKQMVNNIVAVITIVLVTAAIVFVLDLAFNSLNKYGIDKLKDKVRNENQTQLINDIVSIDNDDEGNNAENTNTENNSENNETEQTTENKENAETENKVENEQNENVNSAE